MQSTVQWNSLQAVQCNAEHCKGCSAMQAAGCTAVQCRALREVHAERCRKCRMLQACTVVQCNCRTILHPCNHATAISKSFTFFPKIFSSGSPFRQQYWTAPPIRCKTPIIHGRVKKIWRRPVLGVYGSIRFYYSLSEAFLGRWTKKKPEIYWTINPFPFFFYQKIGLFPTRTLVEERISSESFILRGRFRLYNHGDTIRYYWSRSQIDE